MGDQQPAKNEVERALATMSAGFHTGSGQIAAGIAALQDYLTEAPAKEQERLRAAIVQIVATQARLKGHVERLPAPSWDRFKAMVGILKTQQTILDELGLLVKEHVLPRQLQSLSVAARPAAPEPAPAPEPEPDPPPPISIAGARRLPPRRAPVPVPEPDDEPEPRSLFARAREAAGPAFRGLLAMAVAGVALSLLPRDVKLVDLGGVLIDWVGSDRQSASSEDPAKTADAGPLATAPVPARRSEERAPSSPMVGVAPDRPAPKLPSEPERPTEESSTPAVAAATDRSDPAEVAKPGSKQLAAPARVSVAAAPPAATREEQFVSVVFTHQDYDTVLRALTDLKQQYPNVLIGRKGEVQPVDLGKKGIWHRLVVLPAGPRPQAAKLCDQLAAEGYDRCWVKTY
jgi:hypothetical protein